MSFQEYITGIAVGGVLGGTINGGIAAFNGKNFWTGSLTPKPTVQPSILASIDNGIETNNDISKLSLNIHDENIQQALPQNRGFVYKSEYYYEKVSGIDGVHNWNKTTIEIVAENGQVFENIYRGRSQTLIQFSGNRFGKEGIYELIIEQGVIQHQMFVPGGVINGIPNYTNSINFNGLNFGPNWMGIKTNNPLIQKK